MVRNIYAFIGPSAHDEKIWYKRKLRQEEFIKFRRTFFCAVSTHQDQPLRVQRFADGQASDIYSSASSGPSEWKNAVVFLGCAKETKDAWQGE